MTFGIPVDPDVLMRALARRKEPEWSDPLPIPESARKAYARFTRELAAYEDVARIYKVADARVEAAKAELVYAIQQAVPDAMRRNVQWDSRDGTYQIEKASVKPPEWVAEMLAEVEREESDGANGSANG